MNKPLKWLQGWTAQSETDQHHSDIYVMTGQKDSKEAAETRTTKIISINLHVCVITLITWAQNLTHNGAKFRFYHKIYIFIFLY